MAEETRAAVPPTGGPEQPSAGRRRERRFPLSQEPPCRLVLRDLRQAWWARVRNVSASGLGLALAQPLEPGSRLGVELKAAGGWLLSREARTVYTLVGPGASWLAGCAFDSPLTAEELGSLLGE